MAVVVVPKGLGEQSCRNRLDGMDDRLYFKQLLSGQDFATGNGFAHQMVNHSYCVGDTQTREAVLVDPAYDVHSILSILQHDEMNLVGVVLTHYHADHAGGNIGGHDIEGTAQLLELVDVPVHVQQDEVEFLGHAASLSPDQLEGHNSGDTVAIGQYEIELIHTPGHTPGSQCLLVENRLLSGDTLFLHGCGRTDLPGGDPTELYYSLTQRLDAVPDTAELFPGHHYADDYSSSMADTRRNNSVFRPRSAQEWVAAFAS